MEYFGNFLGIDVLNQKKRRQFTRFAIFVFAACLAHFHCLPDFVGAEESMDADDIVKRSVVAVSNLKTIECNLRMDVWVDGVEFTARGRYEEQMAPHAQPTDFLKSMYRLDVNFMTDASLAPGSDPNRMTIVCHLSEDREKSQVWQYMSIESKKELRIIRVPILEDAVKRSRKKPQYNSIVEVRNLGGLAAMMRQIDRFYEFEKLPKTRKQDGVDDLAVWKLVGTVREKQYENLLKRFGGPGKRNSLPPDFPSDIEIWIGRDDLFPYKIRYMNRPTESSKKRSTIAQTTYFDVVLNGEEIDPGNFSLFNENGEYSEGMFVDFKDDTSRFIKSLGL